MNIAVNSSSYSRTLYCFKKVVDRYYLKSEPCKPRSARVFSIYFKKWFVGVWGGAGSGFFENSLHSFLPLTHTPTYLLLSLTRSAHLLLLSLSLVHSLHSLTPPFGAVRASLPSLPSKNHLSAVSVIVRGRDQGREGEGREGEREGEGAATRTERKGRGRRRTAPSCSGR